MYFVSPTYLGRPAYILFTPKLMHVAVFFIYFFFLLVWFVWKKKKKKRLSLSGRDITVVLSVSVI